MNMYVKVKSKKNGGYGFAFFEIFARNAIFGAKNGLKIGVGGTELFSRIRFAPPLIPLKFIYWKHEKKKSEKSEISDTL